MDNSLSSISNKKTFKDTIKQKIDEKRKQDQTELSQSILGTINSAHLLYKDYNLDMNYIMRQRVLEYQKMRQQPYSQFIQGMVPSNILDDLNALEERQKQDKLIGIKKEAEKKTFMEEQVQKKLEQYEKMVKQQILQPQTDAQGDEQQNEDERDEINDFDDEQLKMLQSKPNLLPEELTQLRKLKLERKFRRLNNNALNCQMYLKQQFPEIFKKMCAEERNKVKLNEQAIMDQYNAYAEQHPENRYPSYYVKKEKKQ